MLDRENISPNALTSMQSGLEFVLVHFGELSPVFD